MSITRPTAGALAALLLASGAGLAASTTPAAAATMVTTVDDELVVDGDCSLREAIEANNTVLPFDACLPSATITLPPGDYPVQFPLELGTGTTLVGAGADDTTLVCTSVVTCIVNDSPGGPLVLDSLTMTDTQGLFVSSLVGSGPLTVQDSVLTGSDAGALSMTNNTTRVVRSRIDGYATVGVHVDAGTIEVEDSVVTSMTGTAGLSSHVAPVHVARSEVRGHTQHGIVSDGAAVTVVASSVLDSGSHGIVTQSGDVTLQQATVAGSGGNAVSTHSGDLVYEWSTIVGNTGRGLNYSGAGSATLTGTILANVAENCDNPVVSGGHNISDDGWCAADLTDPTDQNDTDPLLAPVAVAAGPTPVAVPQAGSPAIDVGGSCPATDQQGAGRPVDADDDGEARCDAGAVEVQVAAAPPAEQPPATGDHGDGDPAGAGAGAGQPGSGVRPPAGVIVDRAVRGTPTFTG